MAKIHIKNLGPIQDVEFDIKNFNVFIGEQAVGKSTICKAIYFFRLFRDNHIDYLYSVATKGIDTEIRFPKVMNAQNKKNFIDIFGPSWNLDENLQITYTYNDIIEISVSLSASSDRKFIDIRYKKGIDKIRQIEKEMESYHRKRSKQMLAKNINETLNRNFIDAEDIRLYNELNQQIGRIFGDNMPTYYIPAGRILLSLMCNLLPVSNSLVANTENEIYSVLDFINRKFIDIVRKNQNKFIGGISHLYKHYDKKDKFYTDDLPKEIIDCVKGEYRFDGKEECIVTDDGQKIPINFISSGQQEALWLFNLLYMWLLQDEKAFVIIEEPEAHLHPTLQYDIVKFIAEFANLTDSTILITTHSPYILTSANLLLYGGKIVEKNKGEVAKILGEHKYIIPKECNVFEIQQNGTTKLHSLKDDDYRESLEVEKLDKISDDINEKYTKLVYLEDEIEWLL